MSVSFEKLGQLGRMGNQLFQIAAVVSVAADNNLEARLPAWKYMDLFVGEDWPVTIREVTEHHIDNRLYVHSKIQTTAHLNLQGLFQHNDYTKNCEARLRRMLAFRPDLVADTVSKVRRCLPAYPDCIAVHVRRTDYLSKEFAFLNVCTLEYYQHAIDILRERTGCDVLVVSDDYDWCRENFPGAIMSPGMDEREDFCILSQAKNKVISNSTFAWWATWLNPGGEVIAPAPWTRRNEAEGMYLPGWQKIRTRHVQNRRPRMFGSLFGL